MAPAFQLPPPPPDRTRRAQAFLVFAALVVVVASVVAGLPLLAGGGALALGGVLVAVRRGRRQEIGAALALAALDRASRGRFDEARALLDGVDARALASYVGIMVDGQRAALSLYEGDLERAVAEATRGAREGRRLGALGQIYRGSALSIRAVALAGLGRKTEALADVEKVRGAAFRQGALVARAALAEAILLARDGELDALAALVRKERVLLFGATGPRERLIARALARLVAAKKVSVYREPGKRDEEPDAHASWVARIAPEAAAYARAPRLGAALEGPEAIDPAVAASAEKAVPKARRGWRGRLVLALALGMLFASLWALLGASPEAPGSRLAREPRPSGGDVVLLELGCAAAIACIVGFQVARGRRATVALGRAIELRQRGLFDEARGPLTRLAASRVPLAASQAQRELAAMASAHGDFKGAQHHAALGIDATRTGPAALALARPVLLPQLHGELAFALAAQGREARAEEELLHVRTLFPSYPYLARDTFRARLVRLTAASRFQEAAAMARERPVDLFLTMQEEALCDALRVHAGDALPEGEPERIELELREDPTLAAFLDGAAPGLRGALQQGHRGRGGGTRVATGEPERVALDEDDDGDDEAAQLPPRRL